MPSNDLTVRRVVVHHEDPLAGELRQGALIGQARRNLCRVDVELDAEGRAAVHLALDPNRAAHQRNESLRNRKPEPGAAVAACRGGVDLAERLEERVHPIRRDADPGVAHCERETIGVRSGGFRVDVDDNLALLRELDRIRQQVEQDLPESARVSDDSRRSVLVDQAAQLDLFLPGARRDDVECALDAFPEVDRLVLELELAGLDLRVVEDVVDHMQQCVAARADDLGELSLFAR